MTLIINSCTSIGNETFEMLKSIKPNIKHFDMIKITNQTNIGAMHNQLSDGSSINMNNTV